MSRRVTFSIFFILIAFNTNLFSQWIKTSLSNAYVWSFAAKDSEIFAGSGGGGIFLTTNNGTTWNKIDTGLSNLGISSLLINGENIFAGTYGGGVLLSINNGKSWSTTALDSQYVWSLALSDSNIFAGTQKGIYLSKNNGSSWNQINSGLTSLVVNSLITSGGNIFAGTTGGVFLSTNGGTNWTAADSGLTNKYIWSLFSYGSNIYAGTEAGIFQSTNNGSKWIKFGLDSLYTYSFASTDTMLFAGTTGGVFYITKSDSNWSPLNNGLANNSITSLLIIDTNIFAGTYGVYKFSINQIKTVTAVIDDRINIPSEFLLSQNYPNPFNPTTTINYSVTKESLVRIIVYDALGREVKILVNGEKPARNYRIKFDGSSLSSGIYFYRMQAGDFVETKKLILLK